MDLDATLTTVVNFCKTYLQTLSATHVCVESGPCLAGFIPPLAAQCCGIFAGVMTVGWHPEMLTFPSWLCC